MQGLRRSFSKLGLRSLPRTPALGRLASTTSASVQKSIFDLVSPSSSTAKDLDNKSSVASKVDMEVGPRPSGVSESFFSLYKSLLVQDMNMIAALNETKKKSSKTSSKKVSKMSSESSAPFSSLRQLAENVSSSSEAAIFATAIVKFQTDHFGLRTATDAHSFTNLLLQYNLNEPLLSLLCQRRKYGIFANRDQLESLLKGLQSMFLSDLNKTPNNESVIISHLDNLYKCFAVYLYSELCPGQAEYEILVDAGLQSGIAEGKKRSLMTLNEMVSLGYATDKYSKDLMAEAKLFAKKKETISASA